MEKYPIASAAEFAGVDGGRKIVRAGGMELGIFCVAGGYRAYLNLCPHAGAPVCAGQIETVDIPPGSGLNETARLILRCPWHDWEFDLETGRHLSNIACQLTSYPVEVVGETLFVLI